MKLIFLTGKSCSAKTPFAMAAEKQLGFGRLSIDNLYFYFSNRDKEYFNWGEETPYKRDWYTNHKPEKEFCIVEGMQVATRGERELIKGLWGVTEYLVVEIDNKNQPENAKVKHKNEKAIKQVDESYERQRELDEYETVTTLEGFINICKKFKKKCIKQQSK